VYAQRKFFIIGITLGLLFTTVVITVVIIATLAYDPVFPLLADITLEQLAG
jgi:hypothetical protein